MFDFSKITESISLQPKNHVIFSRNRKFNTVPKELRKAANDLQHITCLLFDGSNGWLAGGALRSRIAKDGKSDLDCYFKDYVHLQASKHKILSNLYLKAKIEIDDESLCSISSKIGKIDLVKRFYKDPVECLNDFDFTVCCFAMDAEQNVYWSKEALRDVEDKKLIIYHPTCPLSTFLRVQKYNQKCYYMDLEESVKLANMIKSVEGSEINKTVDRLKNRPHNYSP